MAGNKILMFAHYYYPDVASTGQILKDLAEGLSDEFDVTVICAVPSYGGTVEDKYRGQKYCFENINGVTIIRVGVPEFKKTSKASRVRNLLAYYVNALSAAWKAGKQDYVIALSQPPILGGLLGVWGKRIKHAKMLYWIQDFNPEQAMAVGYCRNHMLLKIMMWLDQYSCRRSDLVVTVGRDLAETLKKRFQNRNVPKYAVINNWVNEKEVYPLPPEHERVVEFRRRHGLEGKFVIMYSGNIGLYYDLENLIKVIGKLDGAITADNRKAAFVFVGGGAMLENLKRYVNEGRMDHVTFLPYQDISELAYSLNAADLHWCVSAKGIKGASCPSKFYGIAAAAKPVLGVLEEGSEIRLLIEEVKNGLVAEPGDYDGVEKQIRWFLKHAGSKAMAEMGWNGYSYFARYLSRDAAVEQYRKLIGELTKHSGGTGWNRV